jgi:lipopolysaccharide/colanic/teichoic acid biosynthesis glycosyltransferase
MTRIFSFFKNLKISRDPQHNSIFSQTEGWSCNQKFTALLEAELKRTYRTNAPLSLIVIEFEGILKFDNEVENADLNSFIRIFFEIISKNSREIDIKCAEGLHTIKILLPDTALSGARIFTEKIIQCLHSEIESAQNEKFIPLLNIIKFKTHPLNHIAGNDTIKATPKVMYKQRNDHKTKIETKEMPLKSVYKIKWNLEPSVSNTLTLPISSYMQRMYFDIGTVNYRYLKRVLDIIGSAVGIVLFFPAAVLISLMIKLTSKGPVLFKQKRLGYLGNEFTFLKFRTMTTNSDDKIHRDYVKKLIEGKDQDINFGSDEKPLYKIENDPRITRIGHYLRKLSLDELPQFLNVIKGDMSLVGPRPPLAYEFENYKYWHYRRVLEVKPGITGLWQVNGRSKTTFNEMVRLDNQYINNQSFLLDTKILVKTMATVFNKNGGL